VLPEQESVEALGPSTLPGQHVVEPGETLLPFSPSGLPPMVADESLLPSAPPVQPAMADEHRCASPVRGTLVQDASAPQAGRRRRRRRQCPVCFKGVKGRLLDDDEDGFCAWCVADLAPGTRVWDCSTCSFGVCTACAPLVALLTPRRKRCCWPLSPGALITQRLLSMRTCRLRSSPLSKLWLITQAWILALGCLRDCVRCLLPFRVRRCSGCRGG
jgi:hypothetical protein